MAIDLLAPILEGGTYTINFFNGRILTAEDLQQEQTANRWQRRQLGRALGEGVVDGLNVRLPSTPAPHSTVVVSPGAAVNRRGQALALPSEVTLAVVPEEPPVVAAEGLFAECRPVTALPTETGAYVLAVSPASGKKERAPKVGLETNGIAASCDSKYVVEGVRFKLIPLDVGSDTLVPAALRSGIRSLVQLATHTAAQRSMLRNLLAHLCLGTPEKPALDVELYDRLDSGQHVPVYGPLDKLRPTKDTPAGAVRLTDCDVPLALIYWTTDRIGFVDEWAVRRRLHLRAATSAPPFPATDRRLAEGEAAYLQFQRQLSELGPGVAPPVGSVRTISVLPFFRFLPAVGVVPVARRNEVEDDLGFFDGLTYRDPDLYPPYFDAAKVVTLLRRSFRLPPIDVGGDKELIWLYRVRENRQSSARPFVIFAHGQLRYEGEAQYDISRWNLSNYSTLVDE